MRPKVVVAILLVAAGLLGLVFLLSKPLRPPSTPATAPAAAGAPPTEAGTSAVAPVAPVASRPVSLPASNAAPAVAGAAGAGTNDAAAHAAYVERRIEELDALAMNSDVKSRDAILLELKSNPDRAIRKAALEAAIQFNDRSVVPFMKEIADQMADSDEKAAILEAIDYINLPSLTEYTEMRRKQKAAAAAKAGQSSPTGSNPVKP